MSQNHKKTNMTSQLNCDVALRLTDNYQNQFKTISGQRKSPDQSKSKYADSTDRESGEINNQSRSNDKYFHTFGAGGGYCPKK